MKKTCPDSTVAFSWEFNGQHIQRIKFLEEYKPKAESVHQDLIKMVTLMRLVHSYTLITATESDTSRHAKTLSTYGLLIDEKYCWVLAMSFNGEKYCLRNLGKYQMKPDEESKVDFVSERIKLCSLLLTAGYETIEEQKRVVQELAERKETGNTNSFEIPSKKRPGELVPLSVGMRIEVLRPYRELNLVGYELERDNRPIFVGYFKGDREEKYPLCVKYCPKSNFQCGCLLEYSIVFSDAICVGYGGQVEISLKGQVLNVTNKLSNEEKEKMIVQLLSELTMIHEDGVIHNDIKPQNIIIHGDVAKLIDFELYKCFDVIEGLGEKAYWKDEVVTSRSGTESYNAPEKKARPYEISPKTDIYSMGLVFIELILGQTIDKDNLQSDMSLWDVIMEKCSLLFSNRLNKVLARMTSNHKADRPNAIKCLEMLNIDRDNEHFLSTRTDFCKPLKESVKIALK